MELCFPIDHQFIQGLHLPAEISKAKTAPCVLYSLPCCRDKRRVLSVYSFLTMEKAAAPTATLARLEGYLLGGHGGHTQGQYLCEQLATMFLGEYTIGMWLERTKGNQFWGDLLELADALGDRMSCRGLNQHAMLLPTPARASGSALRSHAPLCSSFCAAC